MAFGHRDVLVKGYVAEVVISCGAEVIARHPRSYERDDFVFDPIHYLPLLEQKTAALDQAAPLQGWQLVIHDTSSPNRSRCTPTESTWRFLILSSLVALPASDGGDDGNDYSPRDRVLSAREHGPSGHSVCSSPGSLSVN